jgi:hypothetical protein
LQKWYGKTNHIGHFGGFHLFGPMKEALKWIRFSSDEESLVLWKCNQPTFSFWRNWKLVKRWNQCVEAKGDFLVSFLYIYNKCACFWKVPLLLIYPRMNAAMWKHCTLENYTSSCGKAYFSNPLSLLILCSSNTLLLVWKCLLFLILHWSNNISCHTSGDDRIHALRVCIQKFPDQVDNEINNNNKHSLGSNTKGSADKTH